MVRMWVQILARGPIKFNTNYSPEETHEAAVLKKHRNNKANKQKAAAVAAPVQL